MNKNLLFFIVFFSLIGKNIQAIELNSHISLMELDTTPVPSKEDEVFQVVEIMPYFPGCEEEEDKEKRKICSDKKMIDFIIKNFEYPDEARIKGIEGMAVVRFIVEKDGSLSFEEKPILRDPGGGTGEEALRIVQSMPKWNPGRNDDKPVRVTFTLPIKFKLTDEAKTLPEEIAVTIKWDGMEMVGISKRSDPAKYVKATCKMDIIQKIFNSANKGMPIVMKYEKDSKGFTQYFVSVGKEGKKYLISSLSKNKGFKKKMMKELKSGGSIYFFNWEYKKTFLEIMVK